MQRGLFFYDVKVFYRELHFGTAEIVDVDGKINGAVGLAQKVHVIKGMTRDRYVS